MLRTKRKSSPESEKLSLKVCTVEPLYNEVLGTMKITLL